jgi:hypothetical protein
MNLRAAVNAKTPSSKGAMDSESLSQRPHSASEAIASLHLRVFPLIPQPFRG